MFILLLSNEKLVNLTEIVHWLSVYEYIQQSDCAPQQQQRQKVEQQYHWTASMILDNV